MTAGVGARTNNPTNHRCLGTKGYMPSQCIEARYGFYASYESLEDSVTNTVALYAKLYAGLPPDEITRKWANTNNPAYYESIRSCYNPPHN